MSGDVAVSDGLLIMTRHMKIMTEILIKLYQIIASPVLVYFIRMRGHTIM